VTPDPLLLGAAVAAGLVAIGVAILLLRPLRLALEAGREEGELAHFALTLRFLGVRLVHASGSLHVPSLDALAKPSSISGDAQVHGRLRQRVIKAAAPRALRGARWILARTGWRGIANALMARRGDIRVQRLEGRIEYALEDPAAEGRLYGQVMPWLAWLDAGHHFELVPCWTFENTWHGRVTAVLDVWALRLALLFVWRVAVIAWRAPALASAEATARA
jgi:hypothetical protein